MRSGVSLSAPGMLSGNGEKKRFAREISRFTLSAIALALASNRPVISSQIMFLSLMVINLPASNTSINPKAHTLAVLLRFTDPVFQQQSLHPYRHVLTG